MYYLLYEWHHITKCLDLEPSFRMTRERDLLMMSSSTKISISSPKSTTIGPKVRRYSVTDKREETRFIFWMEVYVAIPHPKLWRLPHPTHWSSYLFLSLTSLWPFHPTSSSSQLPSNGSFSKHHWLSLLSACPIQWVLHVLCHSSQPML
jgi:hypothetical protein